MFNINYDGLFHEENIEFFLSERDYSSNTSLFDEIYNYYVHYTPTDFVQEEIVELKIMLSISLKYNFRRNEACTLISGKINSLDFLRYHLRKLYYKILPSKIERENWLDECILYYQQKQSLEAYNDLCRFLEYFIESCKDINKSKYKEIYADSCIEIANLTTGIRASYWYDLALPLYKQLGLKSKYTSALQKYDENMKIVNSEMTVITTKLDNKDLQRLMYLQQQVIKSIFENPQQSIKEKISMLSSILIIEDLEGRKYRYTPFFDTCDNSSSPASLIDFCSTVTFSGNKTVKTSDDKLGLNWIGRELTREMQITPAIEGLIESISDKTSFIEQLLDSDIIFESDRRHFTKALNFFFEKDYDTFIYIIIPNFEKLLRNILIFNNVPDYINKNTDTDVQTTLNLTETLSKLKENQWLHPLLIEKISQELNEEEFENYRNKLSHREDDTIFSKKVAFDLFLLFIQIINNIVEPEGACYFLKAQKN